MRVNEIPILSPQRPLPWAEDRKVGRNEQNYRYIPFRTVLYSVAGITLLRSGFGKLQIANELSNPGGSQLEGNYDL